ncbi:MAG TPA: ankyrin repeat domain-containing protein [Spirochaetota bacterium]|nr:ankyrin repeat domain-containing protein [Spirochaetota bacterium]HPU89626.1 ankyrin repeat domain-containing protein [Spirochaetota bacterium]
MKTTKALFLTLITLLSLAGCTTPLQKATVDGDIKQVEALINKGADVNEIGGRVTPLWLAIAYNVSIDIIRLLLDKGADPNGTGGDLSRRPIHLAVDKGNANVVKLLLDRGADVSFLNSQGLTPLKMAEERGQTVIARLLRDAEESQYKKLSADKSGKKENVIILKDGSEIRGEIVSQTRTAVTVKTKYATMTIEKKNIREIKYK